MQEIQIKSISWESPEYIQKERSVDWFWSVGIVSILGAGLAVYFGNYLFGILILISGGMFFLLSIHTPREIDCSISNDGFKIGEKNYPLKSILYFDIKNVEDKSKITLYTNERFMPLKSTYIPTELSEEVKNELIKIVEKKDIQESHAVNFMDKLGL